MRSALLVALLALSSSNLAAVADEPKAQQDKPGDETLGKKPPEGAVVLFGGENLDGWVKAGGSKSPAEWKVSDGILAVTPGKGSIQTEKSFGDFQLHVEFNVPYMP